ncbi:hypothetical protein HDV57DRAFT_487401 [Trichoderma longibrachiatum]
MHGTSRSYLLLRAAVVHARTATPPLFPQHPGIASRAAAARDLPEGRGARAAKSLRSWEADMGDGDRAFCPHLLLRSSREAVSGP